MTGTGDHWRSYGLAAAARGDWATAADALNRYLVGAPHDTEAHYALAGVYLQSGRPDYAVQLMDGLVRAQPQNADAAFYRGCVFQQSGRQPEALADFQRAAQLNPAHLGALQALQASRSGSFSGVPGAGLAGSVPAASPVPGLPPLPAHPGPAPPSYGAPTSSLMTSTSSDSDDLVSLLGWGAVTVFGLIAVGLFVVGIGMTVSRGSDPTGWLLLSGGVVLGLCVLAGVIYMTRQEIRKV